VEQNERELNKAKLKNKIK